ncbi:putative UPF0481 protein At3g02645 [Cucurbita pepo subsp. pepo]|uniref:putative UPF0481 protein At3g02645 n=1 Tax=Cucurbita pepo subsp. pepo TaxID=3664 RepID=UPI000C9D7942|nr:putative UPF0481 protein At3g02645 [Cucurbita pepo subsp. pepo]
MFHYPHMNNAMKSLDEGNPCSSSPSILRSKSGERRWVVYINDIIHKHLKNPKSDISSSIFIVPKFLSAAKPQHYTPQFLALGPYHHFSQELYDNMERYKLMIANQIRHQIEFQSFVCRLSQLDLHIRGSYHRRLDLDADTLALIMAIDALFLLELLYSQVQNHDLLRPLNKFITVSRCKRLSNDAVVRDIVKLENQIPLFVLREIFAAAIQCEATESDDLLASVLVGFCIEISPLNLTVGRRGVIECAHVLDVLYRLILPENLECSGEDDGPKEQPGNIQQSRSLKGNYLWSYPWNWMLDCFKILRGSKKVFEFIGRLLDLLPIVGGLVSSMEENPDRNRVEILIEDKTPLMEAGIKIPTASQLLDTGVSFKQSASIKTIKFEAESVTLFLPVIKLGANSEVILRNLVAYEAMAMPDILAFSRYLHLMNSLIDTAEDVKILKDAEIVVMNGMKKDEEVAVLFNGIMTSSSMGLSAAKELDEAINGVNKYYKGRPKVKASRAIKKYVYSSWRILALMATLMVLGLLVLQSFCSVYNCPRLFGTLDIGGDNS